MSLRCLSCTFDELSGLLHVLHGLIRCPPLELTQCARSEGILWMSIFRGWTLFLLGGYLFSVTVTDFQICTFEIFFLRNQVSTTKIKKEMNTVSTVIGAMGPCIPRGRCGAGTLLRRRERLPNLVEMQGSQSQPRTSPKKFAESGNIICRNSW